MRFSCGIGEFWDIIQAENGFELGITERCFNGNKLLWLESTNNGFQLFKPRTMQFWPCGLLTWRSSLSHCSDLLSKYKCLFLGLSVGTRPPWKWTDIKNTHIRNANDTSVPRTPPCLQESLALRFGFPCSSCVPTGYEYRDCGSMPAPHLLNLGWLIRDDLLNLDWLIRDDNWAGYAQKVTISAVHFYRSIDPRFLSTLVPSKVSNWVIT